MVERPTTLSELLRSRPFRMPPGSDEASDHPSSLELPVAVGGSSSSTRTLMTAFYEALEEGASVEQALQRGQDALPKDGELSHPFYWAGFIAVRGPG